MKMSAARIRSVFRRHNSAQEQVFRLSRNVAPPTTAAVALAPAGGIQPQPASTRLAALDQHYQTAMKRELARLGLSVSSSDSRLTQAGFRCTKSEQQ